MIKVEAKYDSKKDSVNIKYKSEKSNTLEHLYLVMNLIEQIIKNDLTGTSFKEIISLLERMYKEKEKIRNAK